MIWLHENHQTDRMTGGWSAPILLDLSGYCQGSNKYGCFVDWHLVRSQRDRVWCQSSQILLHHSMQTSACPFLKMPTPKSLSST